MGAYRSSGAGGPCRQNTVARSTHVLWGRVPWHSACLVSAMSGHLPQAALCPQPSQRLAPGSSMETGSICLKTKGLKSTVLLSGSKEHSFYSLVPGGEVSGILGNRCVECSIWGRRQRLGKTCHRSLCKGPSSSPQKQRDLLSWGWFSLEVPGNTASRGLAEWRPAVTTVRLRTRSELPAAESRPPAGVRGQDGAKIF